MHEEVVCMYVCQNEYLVRHHWSVGYKKAATIPVYTTGGCDLIRINLAARMLTRYAVLSHFNFSMSCMLVHLIISALSVKEQVVCNPLGCLG